jgi:hypothetical protein
LAVREKHSTIVFVFAIKKHIGFKRPIYGLFGARILLSWYHSWNVHTKKQTESFRWQKNVPSKKLTVQNQVGFRFRMASLFQNENVFFF